MKGMKIAKYRLVCAVTLLFMLAGALVFAEGKGEKADGQVTVTYTNFSAGEDNAEVLKQMIEVFERDNPGIKIENDAMAYGDYFTQLVTRIAGGNPPDCFELNMENFLAYALRAALLSLNDLIESTNLSLDVYSEGVLDACSFDGNLYAIPLMFSTVVMIYNKDLFDRAGIAYPSSDWTWEDSLEAGKKITAPGEDIWGMYNSVHFWEFYKVVQQNGGSLMSPDGSKFTINSPNNVATLQYMADRIWKHHVMPNETERADRGEKDLFIDGRLGMLLSGVWAFNDLQERVTFPWGVEVEPGNTAKATHFFANVGCISNSTKKAEAALKFLNTLGSHPEIVDMRLTAQWELPTVSDPALMKRYLEITPPDNKIAVLNSLDYAVKPPALEQFAELTSIINPKIESVRDNIMTPQEALDLAQKEAEEKIKLN